MIDCNETTSFLKRDEKRVLLKFLGGTLAP